jgi:hypothetical protein
MTAGKGDKRGYSWETFTAGNTAAQKHGAYSSRNVEPLAREIATELRKIAEYDYLSTPRFAGRLMDYARAEASLRLYSAWTESMTIEELTTAQRTHPPLEIERRMGSTVEHLAVRLGFYPEVPPDVAKDIAASRRTLAKRAEAKQMEADLRTAIGEQRGKWWDGL